MKIYLTVDIVPDRHPQEDPKVKNLEKNGWKLDHVHFPDGSGGQRAEVELSKERPGDEGCAGA